MANRRRIVRATVVAVLLGLAWAPLLGRAILETMRGNGATTCMSVYGMEIRWVTVLTLSAAVLLALFIALALRWWERRDDLAIGRLFSRRVDGD